MGHPRAERFLSRFTRTSGQPARGPWPAGAVTAVGGWALILWETSLPSSPLASSPVPLSSVAFALGPRWRPGRGGGHASRRPLPDPAVPVQVGSGQGGAGIGTNQAPQAPSTRCPPAGHRGDSGPRVPSGRQAGTRRESPAARSGPASVGDLLPQGRRITAGDGAQGCGCGAAGLCAGQRGQLALPGPLASVWRECLWDTALPAVGAGASDGASRSARCVRLLG